MAFTFKQLKQAKSNLMAVGLDPAAAAGVLSSSAPEVIEKIIAGDIPQGIKDQRTKDQRKQDPQHGKDQGTAQRSAGLPTMAHDQVEKNGKEKTSAKRSRLKRSSAPQAPALDCPQECAHDCGKDQEKPASHCREMQNDAAVNSQTDDIIQDPVDDQHALPAGLYDDICASIDYYCDTHDIKDKQKIHPLQWQGICYRIGETIKARKLLHDFPREKSHGGTVYDGEKVAALLAIYGVICSDYKQVAFTFNFQRFSGVSREYFNDYTGKGLTSSRVGIVEKAQDLQRASLVGAVTGGGSATVGNIFLSKALAGLQETVTVQHVSAAAAPQVAALPVFDDVGALLPDNSDEK